MNTVTITRLLDSDLETVWAQIEDVTKVENWHPAVASVDLLSTKSVGQGATRRCHFYDGTDVLEEVIEVPEEHSLLIDIREFKAPMKSFTSLWKAVATPSGATQLTVVMNYEMKFGLFGSMVNALFVKGKMPKLMARVLSGLEHHIQSGNRIGKDFEMDDKPLSPIARAPSF